jgi:hypothetical protein
MSGAVGTAYPSASNGTIGKAGASRAPGVSLGAGATSDPVTRVRVRA